MASSITQYRVFIASPGGLEKERQTFRDVVNAHNDADGLPRGSVFTPVGWEVTLRGVGRPQEKINEEVKTCDYFVLILWDRWGSPPGNDGKYTSGTEEEYKVAWECYENPSHSMREIIVLFKAVDPRQLSDPGKQLQAVQTFKKQLEAEKHLFFDTFDDLESLAEKLRKYLAQWTRDHEEGNKAKVKPVELPTRPEEAVDSIFSNLERRTASFTENDFVRDAEKLLRQGKLTDAEGKLVQAVMPGDDMNAFRTYGQFLLKAHRYTDAESVFKRMLKVAQDANEASWVGSALASLGGVYRLRRDYIRAYSTLTEALKFKQHARDQYGVACVNIWLGDLCAQFSKWGKAKTHYDQATNLLVSLDEDRMLADTWAKLAKAAAKDDDIDAAQSAEGQARILYLALNDQDALKGLKMWRKSVLAKTVLRRDIQNKADTLHP